MLEIRNFQQKGCKKTSHPVNGSSSDTWHGRQAKAVDRNELLNVHAWRKIDFTADQKLLLMRSTLGQTPAFWLQRQ